MIKRFSFIFFICIFCSSAWGSPTYNVVYRVDDRPLSEIQTAGGIWPWREGIPDNNLLHHFEGESLEDHSSTFVSTTASLRIAVEHAASLARPNSEEPFDEDFVTYIYTIRPDIGFFDVDASLIYARSVVPENSPDRQRIDSLIGDYTGMEEVVAWEGLTQNRIISYAELNGAMLQQYGVGPGSPLFSEAFWSARWMSNANYDPQFDGDTSNTAVYTSVSGARGYVGQVINGDQLPVPMSFTCLGINLGTSSSFNEQFCSSKKYLNIKRRIYDKKLITVLIGNILD